MSSKKMPFVLGDDVARALDEIVSINDDLPEAYRKEMQARAEACREERS